MYPVGPTNGSFDGRMNPRIFPPARGLRSRVGGVWPCPAADSRIGRSGGTDAVSNNLFRFADCPYAWA
jgi:hypothetical protein